MNSLINFTLKNKFAVWLLTIIVTVAGLYSGMNMKLETLPDITTPVVTVTTIYPGATPLEVTDKVTKPIEQRLQNLSGVKRVGSSSFQNASQIQVEYSFSSDMDKSEEEVKQVLSDIKLPEGVQPSKVSRLSFNAFPVITYSVSNDKASLAVLTKQVQDYVLPKLEGIEGVANVQISGQHAEEVQLLFDQGKLSKYGLSQDTVQAMIKGSDLRFPLGVYTFGSKEQSVVIDGKFTTIEDLKGLEIPYSPAPTGGAGGMGGVADQAGNAKGMSGMAGSAGSGAAEGAAPGQTGTIPGAGVAAGLGKGASGGVTPGQKSQPIELKLPTVKLGELAKIELVGKAESISRTNGKDAIGIQIVKGADANTVDVVNGAKQAVSELQDKYPDLEMISTMDQGKPIEESVNTMLSKAIFGAVFAMLIILLFLRNFRTTLISVVSIPLSLLIAILALNQMDITLNMMTLGAMTVAIGRVVDDSIVVVENIFRRMSLPNEPLKGKDLMREATKEMFMPIFSSTIVTIAVFLPLGLVQGMIGEMFLPFALTIVFALLASLLVAITIVPMMAHSLFKKGVKSKQHAHEEHPSRLSRSYKKVLNWSLNHKVITSIVAVLLLVGSFALVPYVGVSFLPSQSEKMVIATYSPEPGQTLSDVTKTAEQADQFFRKRNGVETVQYSLGGKNPFSPGSTNQALFFVKYSKDTPDFTKEQTQVLKDLQADTEKGRWGTMDFGAGGMGSNSLKVYVYGDKIEEMKPVVQDLEARMKKIADLKNVKSSLSKTFDEYTLEVNQEKLSELGLTAAEVGMSLSQQRERPVLTTVEKDGEELNVYLQVEQPKYASIDDLVNKKITSRLGQTVAIKDVVEVKKGTTSDTVTRRDGRLVIDVGGDITSSSVTTVSNEVKKEMDAINVPANIEVSMGGVTQDIKESFTQLGVAMAAAIAIVYLILVITFGGGLAPFAILFSLPFTIIGALVALLIAGETISISAMIGALMLIGIVVTNAIVLIDRVIHKEKEGMSTREALLEAGVTRLRPILMTAIATIGALIPLAIGIEGSGIISRGLGVTVIGGLTSSTLLTLLIVPIVYESLSKLRRKDKQHQAAA
ncbi:efflux RND transporter permease subunit [Paenibacillus taiwanensis]|uniref:efflux RND transporter permease subunit n=1 Tax=Paenibacillus taiwanensis TaxID=401638 RepID=UPI0004161D31|nr:efflux RND transporter permease subunit [Paenibacillus taiwanensis]